MENAQVFVPHNWQERGEKKQSVKNENRYIQNYIVGSYTDGANGVKYLTEDIYEDVVENLKQGIFTYLANGNASPKLLVFYQGELVDHNDTVGQMRKKILDGVEKIDPLVRDRGYQEMEKNYSNKELFGIYANLFKYNLLAIIGFKEDCPTEFIYKTIATAEREKLFAAYNEDVHEALEGLDKEVYLNTFLKCDRDVWKKEKFYALSPAFANKSWSDIKNEILLTLIADNIG